MRNGLSRIIANILWLVILVVAISVGNATAQSISGGTRYRTCPETDKLAVTSFGATPSNPQVGNNVTVKMKITNRCPSGSEPMNVQWKVLRNNGQLHNGTVTLAGGATSNELIANWTASAGEQDFVGIADPEQAITDSNRANNTSAHVPVVPTNWRHMTMSNGSFPKNFESPQLGCAGLTINQMSDGSQIATVLSCASSINGLKANPEYFKGVTLKNGWKVDSVRIHSDGIISGGPGGWSWRVQPAVGSTDPRVQIHVWVDRHTAIQYYMELTIRGPAHTSPF